MMNLDQYLIWACALCLAICLILLFRWSRKRSAAGGERRFIHTVLERALAQKTTFDIKLKDDPGRAGLSASLETIDPGNLLMFANGFVADEWKNKLVEAYFRVNQPEGPVFYVFNSHVGKLTPGPETSAMTLAMPTHLRVEKKRHFIRATPNPADILMLAIWPAAPGKRLPRSSHDLGQPAVRWKTGDKTEPVQVENISGGGLALKFQASENGALPIAADKGRQLLCLLVYRPEANAEKPAVFWCSAEIMNVRRSGYAIALGVEFTNWALQLQGDSEIHWTHSSPWQGAKPILKWVASMEKTAN